MTIRSGLFDEAGNAVPLLGVNVRAEVIAGHASAVVRQRYRNDEKKPIEAVYTFPLPSKAVLTGFSMSVGGRTLAGEVQEREEAFRRYDEAITAGHGAALLEQERPNVFTANVGNLLPGEETAIEITYVEPLLADEGAVRWSLPTLVAPRYIPGTPGGDRTAHGRTDPTDRVPDADRISPPIAPVDYGVSLDLTFDLGVRVEVESPSHAIVVTRSGDRDQKSHVTFSQKEVALDRDVVVTAWADAAAGPIGAPIASAMTHRKDGGTGALALTLVPDLGAAQARRRSGAREVVFVLDRSGSMGGAAMTEARTALRLCLRQLHEGDRFGILAFDDTIEALSPELLPFTQSTLQRADAWLEAIDARGGTELLEPMREAGRLAPNGVIVVLTDGEVGNEDEILAAFMAAQETARVYSFGIGTNVSDALLLALADRTGGAVEMIYPGERVDEKVVAQFARATAPRVTELTIKTRGIELGEIAPAEPRALVDSEPFCLFATYEEPGRGAIELRGKLDGEAFFLEIPVELDVESDRPVIAKLWAQARIRDLERSVVTGRRAEAMKQRIVKLAVAHGVSSKFTSFVVVEKRTGERRTADQPSTRIVPVNAPHGWAMFAPAAPSAMKKRAKLAMPASLGMPMPGAAAPMPRAMASIGFGAGAPPPAPAAFAPPMEGVLRDDLADAEEGELALAMPATAAPAPIEASKVARADADPVRELLSRQAASGLWEEPGREAIAVTLEALHALVRLGLSTAHAVHGAQIRKALEALLALLDATGVEMSPRDRELALGLAWLLASGRRTRQAIEAAAQGAGTDVAGLVAAFASERSVRARVDTLSQSAHAP